MESAKEIVTEGQKIIISKPTSISLGVEDKMIEVEVTKVCKKYFMVDNTKFTFWKTEQVSKDKQVAIFVAPGRLGACAKIEF